MFGEVMNILFHSMCIFALNFVICISVLTGIENSTIHIILPENMRMMYLGKYYADIFLLPEGILAFDSRARYNPDRNYRDPLKPWKASDDYPFIVPLLFGEKNKTSNIAYHIHLSSNKSSKPFLSNLDDVISRSFVGTQSASMTLAISVMWHNKEVPCQDENICQNVNISLTLATDGRHTFAMVELNDTSLLENVSFQSGFNYGYGRGWFDVVLPLGRSSGRYLYLIHSEKPVKGGCDVRREYNEGEAYISPKVIDMFGGNILEVSGPCFYENDTIKLVLGDLSHPYTIGDCYRVSEIKAKCEIPPLTARGRVMVGVSLDDGASVSYTTRITIVHPTLTSRLVALEGSGWGGTSARDLSVRWNASKLSVFPEARADIFLVGYSEKTFWGLYLPIVKNIPVYQGYATFNASDVACDATCAEYEAGFVAVKVRNITHANLYRIVTSGAIPFGWLMKKYLEQVHGKQWLYKKCTNWYQTEVNDMQWIKALDSCPCSLQQALSDFGRWQTDLSCNMYSKRPTCAFHKGAVHCVRSVNTIEKAGNQCCYGADGLLRYSEDTFQGSTPDRYHDWGADPYGTPGSVPSLSHGLADVMTFFYCCIWANYKNCDFYMDVRPTKDCKAYMPPMQAMVFGQSHLITFDGVLGLVCGTGDYILYQDSEIIVEGRFQKNTHSRSSIKSTILTAVGIRVKEETVVIKLKSRESHTAMSYLNSSRSEHILDVTINNEYQFFNREDNKWQDFEGIVDEFIEQIKLDQTGHFFQFLINRNPPHEIKYHLSELTVVNNDDLSMRRQSNFTILSKNGHGILVFKLTGSLHVTVSSSSAQIERSEGLLSRSDRSSGTTSVDAITNNDTQFSWISKWYVNDTLNQIIPYSVGNEMSENECPRPLLNFTSEICLADLRCLYDLFTTGDVGVAKNTRNLYQRYSASIRAFSKVRSCGLLSVPRSTKSNFNYSMGSTVSITGCRVGNLKGHTEYVCTSSENSPEWRPSITASCHLESATKPSSTPVSLIAGIITSVVVVLIIIVTIVVIVQRRKREDKYAFQGEG